MPRRRPVTQNAWDSTATALAKMRAQLAALDSIVRDAAEFGLCSARSDIGRAGLSASMHTAALHAADALATFETMALREAARTKGQHG